jgi:hypothetical protein
VRLRIALLIVVSFVLAPGEASAQVPWDSPFLVGPGSPRGLSLLLVDPGPGLGLMAQWTGPAREVRLGYRLGLSEDRRDKLAVFGGVDVSGPLTTHGPDFPLDMIWLTGAGIGAGDETVVSVPVGVSLGRVVDADDVRIHPYLSPRLLVDIVTGDERSDDMELGFALDLGVDFAFSGRWALRLGASVGDREGIALGFVVPGVG